MTQIDQYWYTNMKLATSLSILRMMTKREGFNPLLVQLKGESPLNFQLHFITTSAIAIELLIIVVPNRDGSKFSCHSSELLAFTHRGDVRKTL